MAMYSKHYERSNQKIRNKRQGLEKNFRFQSVRAVKRMMEKIVQECYQGRRPTSHMRDFATAAKFISESIIAENILRDTGGDVEVQDHPFGLDGGEQSLGELGHYVNKKLIRKMTTNRWGAPVEEITETYEGPTQSGDDEDEDDANAIEGPELDGEGNPIEEF